MQRSIIDKPLHERKTLWTQLFKTAQLPEGEMPIERLDVHVMDERKQADLWPFTLMILEIAPDCSDRDLCKEKQRVNSEDKCVDHKPDGPAFSISVRKANAAFAFQFRCQKFIRFARRLRLL